MPSTPSLQTAAEIPTERLPTFADIEAAAGRLAGHAVVTPLLTNAELDRETGARVLIKPEMLQRTCSFKFRGAYNKISRLAVGPERPRAVVAYSSGNHAQGVAAAAALAGIPAVIVMPSDAPAIKVSNTKGYGAEVILYDRRTEQREEIAARIAAERSAAIIPPYEDPDVIAGQGTAAREIVLQAREIGAVPDLLVAPCSGGGLLAGTALAMETLSPNTRIYSAEPEGFDDMRRSLAAGRRVENEAVSGSFCDALLARRPGEITFEINRKRLAGGVAVTDAEVAAAMEYAFRVLKLVTEPGGAVGLAALLTGKLDARGRTVAVLCSGGNVDAGTFCKAVGGGTS